MKVKLSIVILVILIAIGIFQSCKNIIRVEPDLPFNPFDTITYDDGVIDDIHIDSSSFLGLHTYIFSTTCAVPACHDGSFEPDFRTVQSAYNTLVYAPVIKNNEAGTFTYRVVPGDTAMSWLHERITTTDETLGRMPLYDTLYPSEREKITKWIMEGAKDVMGNSPILPNYQPTTFGYLAFVNDTLGARLDTIRADVVSPMQLPTATTVEIWFGTYDTDPAGDYFPGGLLTYNKARISPDPFYFTGAVEYAMDVESLLTPYIGTIYFSPEYTAPYYQHFTFNTSDFTPGRTYFMRFYVKDTDHDTPTEIPDQGSQYYLLTYFAFIIS